MAKRVVKRNSSASIVTIGEAYRGFEREKQAKGLVEKTLFNYKQSLEYFKKANELADADSIARITKDMVIDWVNTMRENELKAAAINHYIRDIRAFLYWCMGDERKYIEQFKIEQVSAQEPKQKTYTKEDIKRLLAKPIDKTDNDFVEWRTWAIVNLAYDMGARAGTIISIQMNDVNLQNRSIYLRHTKNKSLTHAVISSQCAKVLKEYINDWRATASADEYLFCSYSNEQLQYNALAHSFARYCERRKVEMHSIHGLRHTFATELAENTNGDMVRVQKALGHSSIDMARKYINLANVSMGDYDDISPLARVKDKRGRPKKKITKN